MFSKKILLVTLEVIQPLFIYADILRVLRFIPQCEVEDIFWIMTACLSETCLLLFIFLEIVSSYGNV